MLDDFLAHIDEWERIAKGEARVFNNTGYAVVAMNGRLQEATFETWSQTCVAHPQLPRKLLIWGYGEQNGSAHSVTAQKILPSGDIKVVDPRTGQIYPEHAAIQAIMGAEPRIFEQLLSHVLFS